MLTNRAVVLPMLLVISFPVLYYGGNQGSTIISGLGLAIMVGGVAMPAIARIIRKVGKT